jgi:osmotically-inducible protein OsmY
MRAIRSGAWIGIVLSGTLGLACSNADQRRAEEQAREAAARAEAAVERTREEAAEAARKAQASAETFADQAKDVAAKAGVEARDAALKGAAAAAEAGAEAAVVAGNAAAVGAVKAAGLLRTGAVKAALLADKTLDVSDVDVTTDEPRRLVTLTGRVRTAAQKSAVEAIARGKAPGYTIDNKLVVK